MKAIVGVQVDRMFIRAALREGPRLLATREVHRDAGTLDQALVQCVSALPATRRARRIVVALGPDLTQFKVVVGLPPVSDRRAFDRMIAEGARRFFVGDPARWLTAARRMGGDTVVEGFDRAAVDSVVVAAARLGLRNVAVVSLASVAALIRVSGTGTLAADGGTLEVDAAGGFPTRVARHRGAAAKPQIEVSPFAIAAAAPGALAAGALAIIPVGARGAPVPRWRGWIAVGVAAAAAIFLALTPALSARRTAHIAALELRELASAHREAMALYRRAQEVDATIAAVRAFTARPSVLSRLASITRALPLDAAMIALSMDTTGGSMVMVSDRAVNVLAALDSAAAFRSPQVAGPVTPERIDDAQLERATIRFQWSRR
jgi:hypothetical protein